MKIEIKINIGGKEVTMKEAREIYDGLKEIFEKKTTSPLDDLYERTKKQVGSPPWRPLGPFEVAPKPYWQTPGVTGGAIFM